MDDAQRTSKDNFDTQVLALVHAFDDPLVPELYTVILDHIKRLDRSSTIASLQALLAHHDPNIRGRAGEVLLELDAAHQLPRVLPLLEDVDAAVRCVITSRLIEFGDTRAVDALTQILLHEPDSTCRCYAILALERSGDVRALPALNHAVQYDDGTNYEGTSIRYQAHAAIQALQRKGTA